MNATTAHHSMMGGALFYMRIKIMNIRDIINRVNIQFPNSYDKDMILAWINDLERDIAEFFTHFKGTEDYIFTEHTSVEEEPQVQEPRIYVPYVISQVCLANEEYDRYNNHAAVFQSAYQDWKDQYIREHMPRYKGKVLI